MEGLIFFQEQDHANKEINKRQDDKNRSFPQVVKSDNSYWKVLNHTQNFMSYLQNTMK